MLDQLPHSSEPAGASALPIAPEVAAARLEPLAVPFGRFTSTLRRHLWVVLLCPVLIVGIAFAILRQMPKQYTAEASILIEPQRTQVSDLQAISPDSGDVASLLRTQIDILRSPSLTLQVVHALHLVQTPEFQPHGGLSAHLRRLLQRFGWHAAPLQAPPQQQMAERVAMMLSDKISFVNEARSSVLRVAVTTQNARLSADIANKIAAVYLDFKRQEKFEAMQRAHDWFQEQMGKLAGQLRADGLAVEQYRLQHRLDDQPPDDGTPGARPASINRQQLDAISNQIVQVARERALKEGQLADAEAVMRGQAVGSTLPAVLASPVIVDLLGQIATATGREAQLASQDGVGNPDLIAARAQLRRLQGRLQGEMANICTSLRADVRAARMQEQLLRDQMEHLRQAVSGENAAQVPLQVLQTRERATRSIYESFLVRATQLANVAGIQEPDASLVSSAQPPLGPSGPQVTRLVVVAGALSLVLGIGLAFAIERLCRGFTQPEQLEAVLGLPLLAMIPNVPRKALRCRGGRTDMSVTAALDNMRGQLRALGEARPRLVMVTSALPQDGKSVFAAEFARNAAAAGWRVMLVECDLYRPSLAEHFRIAAAPGLCDILAGRLLGDLGKVVHEVAPRLHVIVGGRPDGDTQELLASNRMTALLAAVRTRYDLVVLDTPPVLPVADTLVLVRHADATLLVVRWEKTARHAVQDGMRRLRECRANLIGTVMTRVDPRRAAASTGRMSYSFSYNAYYATRLHPDRRIKMPVSLFGRVLIHLLTGIFRIAGFRKPLPGS